MDSGDDKTNQGKRTTTAATHLKHLLQRILIGIHIGLEVYAGRNRTDHVEVILFHDHSSIQDFLALTDQLQTNHHHDYCQLSISIIVAYSRYHHNCCNSRP